MGNVGTNLSHNEKEANGGSEMKKYAALGVGILASILLITAASAASYTLFGDAIIVSAGNPGNAAQTRSDSTIAPSYGGVSFAVPSTTWSSFLVLSADYNVTDDSCGLAVDGR